MTCPYFHTPSPPGLQVICPYCGEVGPTASPEPINAARSEAKPIVGVEEVAELLVEHVRKINRVIASGMHEGKAIREAAQAILSKLQGGEGGPAQSQPLTDAGTPAPRSHGQPLSDGWVLVPRDPTPEMLDAVCDRRNPGGRACYRGDWRAMIEAAPPADTTLSGAQQSELSRSAPDEPPLPTPPPEEG